MKSERLLDLSKEVFETNSDPRMRSHYVSHEENCAFFDHASRGRAFSFALCLSLRI